MMLENCRSDALEYVKGGLALGGSAGVDESSRWDRRVVGADAGSWESLQVTWSLLTVVELDAS